MEQGDILLIDRLFSCVVLSLIFMINLIVWPWFVLDRLVLNFKIVETLLLVIENEIINTF